MKILYILSGTGTNGGASKSFLAMAKSMVSAGNEIVVVTPDEKGMTQLMLSFGWKVKVINYEFCALPPLSINPKKLLNFFPSLIRRCRINLKAQKTLLEFVRDLQPDIIHENTSVTNIGYYASKMLDIPHVTHIREYGWKDFHLIIPNLKSRLRLPFSHSIAITKDLANYRCSGVDNSHVRVIYNGVVEEDDIRYDPVKDNYFLYAGRIEPGKGIDDLIEAYIKYVALAIRNNKVPLQLKIAGAAPDEDYKQLLNDKLVTRNSNSFVEWLGVVTDMRNLYSKAVATIIPSHFEGFGRVMPEAMAYGSLCVVRSSAGLAEQLENGVRISGQPIAFSYLKQRELISILSNIATNYQEHNYFSSGGIYQGIIMRSQHVIRKLYTREINGEQTLSYYKNILKKNY